MKKIIKASGHATKFANIGKQEMAIEFINDFNDAVWWLVDYLWNTRIQWGNHVLDIKNNQFDVPSFISTTDIPIDTPLSARALQIAASAALGIVKARTTARRKQFYMLRKLMREGKYNELKRLQSKIDRNPLKPPKRHSVDAYIMLNSQCCEYIESGTTSFDGFLKLKCLGKKYGVIYIPVKETRHSRSLANRNYQRMTSWQLAPNEVRSIWELEKPPVPTGDKVIGADQGVNKCVSLSDGQMTGACPHGHTLKSILSKMARKKPGSKAFNRAQEHRKNYVNYSIKQLNFAGVKEVRLEKLVQVRRGRKSSKLLSHWTYTEINAQMLSICIELGVPVILQDSQYRSQRCHDCGWTQKSNRKGEEFICRGCGCIADADVNGALNHEVDLYPLPFGFRQQNHNRRGFYWTPVGAYDSSGQELIVPVVIEDDIV